MTDKEVVKQVFIKAYENGYRPPICRIYIKEHNYKGDITDLVYDMEYPYLFEYDYERTDPEKIHINEIIFSIDFAKAFWGNDFTIDDKEVYGETCSLYFYRWQLHLTSLVLEKEPLKYLEKFV